MSNRQERRHGESAPVKRMPTYNLNQDQVAEIAREEMESQFKVMKTDLTEKVTLQLIATFILALHETTGFGKTRLSRVLERLVCLMEGVEAGELKIEDLILECNKLGIEVQ